MSFTSSSAKARARKEYILSDASDVSAPKNTGEYRFLRSNRFGSRKKQHDQQGLVLPVKQQVESTEHKESLAFENPHLSHDRFLSDTQRQIETESDLLAWLCGNLTSSPTANLMLQSAQRAGYALQLTPKSLERGYMLDVSGKIITLDTNGLHAAAIGRSSHYKNTLLLSLLRGLRDLYHTALKTQYLKTYTAEAALFSKRAECADIETVSILCGWELRASGHADFWRYILGSEIGDMAMTFTKSLEKDLASYNDGSALTRAFCQWYADGLRVGICDHETLESMDESLKSFPGSNPFGHASMRAGDIEALSKLPEAGQYLKGMGGNICADPYFMSIHDPINESQLFQIAYEAQVVLVGGVPFRDKQLARLIFPAKKVKVRD